MLNQTDSRPVFISLFAIVSIGVLFNATGRARPQAQPTRIDGSALDESSETHPDAKITAAPKKPENDIKAMMIGVWEDDVEGGRVLTRKDDGTDVVVIKLKGLKRLIAKKLTMYANWSVEGDMVHLKLIKGEPAAAASVAFRLYGQELFQKIIRVNEHEMVLECTKDGTIEHWRRGTDE
ncbi:MAG: hypothetical protein CMJ78_24965 [Planctomycetaceae bacterium]|nr:hypothetical protein [Planctomycetaceae bacterium]